MKIQQESITFENAMSVKKELDAAFGRGDFAIDMSAVKRIDSTLVSLMLHAKRRAAAAGKTLAVTGVPVGLGELVKLYGLEKILP